MSDTNPEWLTLADIAEIEARNGPKKQMGLATRADLAALIAALRAALTVADDIRAEGRAEVVSGIRAWCAINEIAASPLDWEWLGEFLSRVESK